MTRETLEKLNNNQRMAIEAFRKRRHALQEASDSRSRIESVSLMAEASGYTRALMDAGVLTDRERQILFIYTTV